MSSKRRSTPPPELRERAEAALSATLTDIGRMSAEEIQRLVHELQVHQIELELQNEELRRSQADLASSRDNFNHLYDFAPVGYVTLSPDGDILSANLTLAAMLGVERGTLIGGKFIRFVTRDSRDVLYLHQNASIRAHRKQVCELRIQGPGEETFFARMETIGVVDSGGGPVEFRSAIIDITDRELAEAALRESEQRFRNLTHGLPLMVWVTDAAGNQEFVNETFLEFFGVPPEDSGGDCLKTLIHPDDLAGYAAEFDACLAARRPFHAEVRCRRADGEWRWLESWGRPRWSELREFLGFAGTSTDITDRKRDAEELARVNASLEEAVEDRTAELRESEERYRQLIQVLPVAVYTCDAEGKITLFNAAAAALWGQTPEIGRDRWGGAYKLLTAEGKPLPLSRSPIARVLRGGKSIREVELTLVRPDGSSSQVLVFPEPIRNHSGELIGAVNVMVDISALKAAEAALHNSARILRKLSRAVEQSPASVIITDTSAVIEYVNPTFTEITGYSVAEALGKNANILKSGTHPPGFYRDLRETIAAGRTWNNEICNRKKNGELFWELIVIAPIEDEDGKISHYVSIAEDITDRQQALAELHDREQRLASILDAAVDAIITIDRAGVILSVNPATERIFGYRRAELLGKNVKILMPQPYRDDHDSYLKRYHETGEAHIIGSGREVSGRRKDGSTFPADLTVNEVEDLGIYTGIVRDITARKMAEAAQTSLGRIVEESISEIYIVDAETLRFLQVNRGGRHNLGYSMEQLSGMTPLDLISRGDPEQLRARLEVLRSGEKEKIDLQDKFIRKDGSRYDVDISVQMAVYRGRPAFVANVIDSTRRHELEEEVVRATEEEQQRIANDLHDDLGSLLTGIKLRAEAFTGMLEERGDDSAGTGGWIVRMIQDAITKTRTIARGLRPVGAHPEDLMTALRNLADQTSLAPEFECSFECPVPVPVNDPIVSNHLFRIAQEAVNNAVKHSGGSRIAISLTRPDHVIELKVTDDGKGIGRASDHASGLGLHIMRYRASAIRGNLRINCLKSGGTRVMCRAALPGSGRAVTPGGIP